MAIGIGNTGITTPTTDLSGAAAATGSNGLNADDFMKLLVAQLKNQDPNNPLDTKELVTQLSQLTSVQELVTIGTKMNDLTTATNSSAANQSAGLIGKTVTGTADQAQLAATGGATSAVTLKGAAKSATVTITDDVGKVVKKLDLENLAAGAHAISWDGTTTGNDRAPAGTYTFAVDAKDGNGSPVIADMSVSGVVDHVNYDNGTPELVLVGNASKIPLSNITTISQ